MNDSMSVLLASTLLAMGGVGLYLYKASNDDDSNDYEDNYVEHDQEGLFDRFWKGGDDDDDEDDDDDDELSTISDDLSLSDDEESIEKPKKKRTNNKTKRNRKSGGTSKRKY